MKDSKCRLWFCERRVYAKRLCRKHYTNMIRFKTPVAPSNVDLKDAVAFTTVLVGAAESNDAELLRELLDTFKNGMWV